MPHKPDDYYCQKTKAYYYQEDGDLYSYDTSSDCYERICFDELEDEDSELHSHLLTVLEACKKIK